MIFLHFITLIKYFVKKETVAGPFRSIYFVVSVLF